MPPQVTVTDATSGATAHVTPGGALLVATGTSNAPVTITGAAAVQVKVGAGSFIGVVNNSTSAQTVTLTLYDSASGSTGGTPIASIAALGATQIITWPGAGRTFANGLVVLASGVPLSVGIEIYFI